MLHRVGTVLLLACTGLGGSVGVPRAWAEEFERIEGEALAGVPRSKEATPHGQLTVGEIDALPNVLRESRSALLVATTDQGNLTRMLVSPALRRAPGSTKDPVPVLLVERFDTFDAGNLATRLARGKDLILFDGFQVDLDSGQVVPEDQGGDLQFRVQGEGGPRLDGAGQGEALYIDEGSPARVGRPGAAVDRALGPPRRLRRPLPPLRQRPVVGHARPQGRRRGRRLGPVPLGPERRLVPGQRPGCPRRPAQDLLRRQVPAHAAKTTRASSGPRAREPWPGP